MRILKEVLSSGNGKKAQLKSKVSLALAMSENKSSHSKKEYLEAAIAADPENGEALLRLVGMLAKEDKPDYTRIAILATEAIARCRSDQRAECFHMLGLAKLRLKNWNEAIVALAVSKCYRIKC